MKKEYMYQIESESMKQIQQIKNTLQDFFPRLDIPVHSLEVYKKIPFLFYFVFRFS